MCKKWVKMGKFNYTKSGIQLAESHDELRLIILQMSETDTSLSMKMRLTNLLLLVVVAAFASGCVARKISYESELFPVQPSVALSPGDVVDIRFQTRPEYNLEQTVRPNGSISLLAIDEVKVAGLTPDELDVKLTKLYTDNVFTADPSITILVTSYRNQRVVVGGSVRRPGVLEMPDRLTALDAVMESGGFNMREADRKRVVILRRKGDKRFAKKLNLEYAMKREERDVFYVGPGDVVYVPRTWIYKANQWISQYIEGMIPGLGSATEYVLPSTTN